MPYILALDQGTSSSRAILFDENGSIFATAQKEFAQHFPQPGWVEHDAEEIWATQEAVASEVVNLAGLRPRDIAAIGITNQRETTVLWDRATGLPVAPAIVWQDRRTAPYIQRLRDEGCEPMLTATTGLVPDAYFSATKLAWLLEHVPDARTRALRGELAFGTIDSWLVYKLTGGKRHITDASNASRTLLYNLRQGDWDGKLLELFDIPCAVLPEIVSSSGVYGEASFPTVLQGIPIAGIAGDQQAALVGQACIGQGHVKNTYGTGCFMLLNTGGEPRTSRNRLLTTVAWKLGERVDFALEGSVFVGGAVVQWLRDGLGLIKKAGDIEGLARRVSTTDGVYLVPAFAGLGAPHWDPHARGLLCGLTRGTTAAHIARAALESIALQTADLFDAMEADAGISIPELRADGGASANNLLMQIQADLLQRPVLRPVITETTALGAAMLAGLSVGIWKDPSAFESVWKLDRAFEPSIGSDEAAGRRAQWRKAVERSLNWES